MLSTSADTADGLVVGGGAAGIGAALVLGRARRSAHLIDAAGEQRNSVSARMHGTLSRDGEPPAPFYAAGRDELARPEMRCWRLCRSMWCECRRVL